MTRSHQRQWAYGVAAFSVGILATLAGQSDLTSWRSMAEVAGIALVAIGGSLLAAMLATRILATQVFGFDLAIAAEALRGASPFYRENQSVTLTLRHQRSSIRVEAVHEFDVFARVLQRKEIEFSLFTDVGNVGGGGGFLSVTGPDGVELDADELLRKRYVAPRSGKQWFHHAYQFEHNTPAHFRVVTFGTFGLNGRLVWTVENVSKDLVVLVNNYIGPDDQLEVKINHHREQAIRPATGALPDGFSRRYDFDGEVLPYQGFELIWDVDTVAADAPSASDGDERP